MTVNPKFNDGGTFTYENFVDRLLFFNKISQNILEKKPLEKLLDEIITFSKLLLNAEASSLLLYNKNEKLLYFHTIACKKKKELSNKTVKLGEGIAGFVAKHQEVLNIKDCYSDKRFSREFDLTTGFKTRNMLCAPMVRKKELIGVIQVINKNEGEHFTQQDIDLFNALASECALAIENARLTEIEIKTEQLNYELSIARDIQQKLLPDKLPEFDDIDVNAKLIPAKEVGGDYYNVIKISDNETLFIIADVSGKSVSAALIVSTIYSFIQTYLIINRNSFNLKTFVESLNSFLVASTTQDKFATAWFGLYDHKEKTVHSINAGHNPIYVYKVKDKKIIELNKGGLLLGSLKFPYQVEILKLEKDDVLIFYTDGIPEAMNNKMEEYGEERLIKLITKNSRLNSSGLLENIFADIKKFRGSAEQSDDITCGIIKVR